MTQSPSRRRRGGRERSGPAPPPSPEQSARVNPSRRRRRVAARPRGPSLLVFGSFLACAPMASSNLLWQLTTNATTSMNAPPSVRERAAVRDAAAARAPGDAAGASSPRPPNVDGAPSTGWGLLQSQVLETRRAARPSEAARRRRAAEIATRRGVSWKRQASARRGGGLDEEQRLAAARRRRRRAGDDGRPVHGPRSIPAALGAPSLSLAHVLGEPPSSAAASARVRLRGAGWAAPSGGAIAS